MRHRGKVEPVPLGLVQTGPLVEVTLAPHPAAIGQVQAAGAQVPSLTTRLMVDTGAQLTVIERALADQLGLTPIRFTPMVGVSQVPEMCPVYLARISIGMEGPTGQGMAMFDAEVVGMASPSQPQAHRGLLGRDFLMHVDQFVYNGPLGTFEIIGKKPQFDPNMSREEKKAKKEKRKRKREARRRQRSS